MHIVSNIWFTHKQKKMFSIKAHQWCSYLPGQNCSNIFPPYQQSLEYTTCILCRGLRYSHQKWVCPGHDTNFIWWWSSRSGALENVETPSLPFLPGSFWPEMALSARIPSMGQIVWKLLVLDKNTWNHKFVQTNDYH